MKTLEDVLDEIRPVPDPDFVADMERRLELGFPPHGKWRLPRRQRWLARVEFARLRPRAVAAVAASALLALLVTVSVTDSDDKREAAPPAEALTAGESGAATAEEPAFDQAVGRSVAPPPPGGGGDFAPGTDLRRIERSAQLTLASDPNEFDNLADAIFRTADRRNGFVLNSSFTQGEQGFSSGFFELRVPARELQPTLSELSRLATVRARSESGTDVTGSFVSIRDRLRTARALRTSLLRRLELALTDTAVRAIRRRLEIVGNRVGSLRDQLRGVRERTEYATVFVELINKDAGAVTGETDEAVDAAVGSLEDILNFLIRAMGILAPVALVAFLAWLVAARARRRARERSLA